LSDYFNIGPLRPTEAHAPNHASFFHAPKSINVDVNHVDNNHQQIDGSRRMKPPPLKDKRQRYERERYVCCFCSFHVDCCVCASVNIVLLLL
jgi:hypothetical protein